jgi:hypothetical protein
MLSLIQGGYGYYIFGRLFLVRGEGEATEYRTGTRPQGGDLLSQGGRFRSIFF